MIEPRWLATTAVLQFHERQLAQHGGRPGLRDAGLLESALMRPVNAWHYGEERVPTLAALYAHGTVRNHPFVDGNKRTGFMASIVFLEFNGWRFGASEAEVVRMTLALAAGDVEAEGFAAWLADSARGPA
jgi:death-on-curing protein